MLRKTHLIKKKTGFYVGVRFDKNPKVKYSIMVQASGGIYHDCEHSTKAIKEEFCSEFELTKKTYLTLAGEPWGVFFSSVEKCSQGTYMPHIDGSVQNCSNSSTCYWRITCTDYLVVNARVFFLRHSVPCYQQASRVSEKLGISWGSLWYRISLPNSSETQLARSLVCPLRIVKLSNRFAQSTAVSCNILIRCHDCVIHYGRTRFNDSSV